jgi:SlyX protein
MSRDVETLKQQVMDLQAQLAFQEDTISGLDAALAQQQQEILLLRRHLELLHERLQEQARGQGEGAAEGDEKPPHY